MSDKFAARELTVKEMVLCYKAGKGDIESLVAFVESRLAEPIPDLQNMSASEFRLLTEELGASLEAVNKQTESLIAVLMSK